MSSTASIVFAGDLVQSGGPFDVATEVRELAAAADLSLLNLEAPVTSRREPANKSGPSLRMSAESADQALERLSFSAVSCANNHFGDFGPDGVTDTLRYLNERAVLAVGGGHDADEASRPLVRRIGDREIAVLAIAENEFGMATDGAAGANGFDPFANALAIRDLRRQGVDVVVFFHGGTEYLPVPNPFMRRTFRAYVDAGARAVVAAHSHCPVGMETYRGAPILYGLGNLAFDLPRASVSFARRVVRRVRSSPWPTKRSLWGYGHIAALNIRDEGVSVDIVPTRYADGRLRILAGDERERYLVYFERLSALAADEARAAALWDAWVAHQGRITVTRLAWKLATSLAGPKATRSRLFTKNHFACESHRELVSAYMGSEGRTRDVVAADAEEIRLLQDASHHL